VSPVLTLAEARHYADCALAQSAGAGARVGIVVLNELGELVQMDRMDGAPLMAPAAEGIHSVELANAILYSSLENRTVEMPLDSAAYERKLQELIAESKFEKKVVKSDAGEDFAKSFNR